MFQKNKGKNQQSHVAEHVVLLYKKVPEQDRQPINRPHINIKLDGRPILLLDIARMTGYPCSKK